MEAVTLCGLLNPGGIYRVVDLASAVGGIEWAPRGVNGQCRCDRDRFVPPKSGPSAWVSSAALRAVLKVCLRVGGGLLFLTAGTLTLPIIPFVHHHQCCRLPLVAVGNGQNPYDAEVCRHHGPPQLEISQFACEP